jgi:hypothetical protein
VEVTELVPDITLLLQHGLLYGAILGALMSVAFIGTAYLNPEIWISDYPPDFREKYGPIGEKAKRQRKLVGIPIFLLLFGTTVFSIFQFAQLGGELTFFSPSCSPS